ncbi:MAG: fluoride efflux transporter CrcB [Bacillota bacterium]|nr:fluoride efflux transporter CrcB [Bacillota bacterium]
MGVAVAGALGALARYGLTAWLASPSRSAFPWVTPLINVVGSFLLAFLGRWLLETTLPPELRLAVTSGLIGAFTTFSTFTWEALELVREGELGEAALYVAVSVGGGLAAAWVGFGLAGLLARGAWGGGAEVAGGR